MKKNCRLLLFAAFTLSVAAALGCSKAPKDLVPKEQVDADIATQVVPAAGGPDWDFSKDSLRCFEILDGKSTVTGDNASLFVTIASAQGDMDAKLGTGVSLDTMFGGLRAEYTKKGGKWTLEKLTPDHLLQKKLGEGSLPTFFNIAAPLCKFYEKPK
ncbi:MAG: hypothetical protein LC113_08375 [Acidobacteria bacterium]|nr:hypothetical protein [Acidobacteriota bacterium]